MNANIAYCFDKETADKLSLTYKLLKKEVIDGKDCWVFIVDNNELQFDELDKTKVYISNRLNF